MILRPVVEVLIAVPVPEMGLCKTSAPWLTMISPVKVLLPLKTRLPVPNLTSPAALIWALILAVCPACTKMVAGAAPAVPKLSCIGAVSRRVVTAVSDGLIVGLPLKSRPPDVIVMELPATSPVIFTFVRSA